MPVLPEAPPWLHVNAVSPMTTFTRSNGDVELFGHDLGDRDVDALAHVHLAEEGGDAAVGQHGDPGVELVGHRAAACRAGWRLAQARVATRAGHGDADDERRRKL